MIVQDVEQVDETRPEHVDVPEQFAVVDAGTANWVCRKIVEARLYADRVKAWADRELRRAAHEEEWFSRRFGGELERWTRGELAARGGKARSIRLPAAQVGFRRTPATFRTSDLSILMPWCRQHLPEAVRLRVDATGPAASQLRALLTDHDPNLAVEDSLVAADVKKHIEETGELPPGMTAVTANERFYVR